MTTERIARLRAALEQELAPLSLDISDDSAAQSWMELRKQSRDHFIPGKFVCPHGACFDHAGNIFVVEWVEVGRVSKLRKVA